jgi:hypothetical protein
MSGRNQVLPLTARWGVRVEKMKEEVVEEVI